MSMDRRTCALAVVVDAPSAQTAPHVAGLWKDDAARLLHATIADLDERFGGESEPMELLWCVPDPGAFAGFATHGRPIRVPAGPQGARRAAAARQADALGFSHVAVIGPDAPHVPNDVVYGALGQTAQYDVVIGAADEGTTYLLAVRDGVDVFSETRYGTPDEMADIIAAAGNAGLSIAPLVGNFSVRAANDVPRLVEYLERHRAVASPRVLDVCRRIASARA